MPNSVTGLMLSIALVSGCQSKPRPNGHEVRINAAGRLSDRYARSRLSGWDVRANAAGAKCDVLIIQTSIILEDSMVAALHYGAGAYAVSPGGIERFYNERNFRGVAYRDSTGRIWTYGDVGAAEVETLKPCE